MGYRDELEALRAKNEELANELAATRAQLERDRRILARQDEAHPLLGGPTRLVRELELEGELDDEGLELLVEELRREIGELGRTEQLGQTLTWTTGLQSGRLLEVSCVRRRGRTVITIRENLRQLAGGLFGGGLGGVGGGGLGFIIPMALRTPAFIPVFLIAWFALVYAIMRTVYARIATKRGQKLDELVLRLAQRLRREAAAAPTATAQAGSLRIDGAADASDQALTAALADAEAEADAEEESAEDLRRR